MNSFRTNRPDANRHLRTFPAFPQPGRRMSVNITSSANCSSSSHLKPVPLLLRPLTSANPSSLLSYCFKRSLFMKIHPYLSVPLTYLLYTPEWFTFLLPAYPGCPGQRPLDKYCCCRCLVAQVEQSVPCASVCLSGQ